MTDVTVVQPSPPVFINVRRMRTRVTVMSFCLHGTSLMSNDCNCPNDNFSVYINDYSAHLSYR